MADECATKSPAPSSQEPITPDQKPFTPDTLAKRWGCSATKVRQMIKEGELSGFRLGKLIRIPAIEVQRFESAETAAATQAATSSSDIAGSSLSRSAAARIAADTRRELTTRA